MKVMALPKVVPLAVQATSACAPMCQFRPSSVTSTGPSNRTGPANPPPVHGKTLVTHLMTRGGRSCRDQDVRFQVLCIGAAPGPWRVRAPASFRPEWAYPPGVAA